MASATTLVSAASAASSSPFVLPALVKKPNLQAIFAAMGERVCQVTSLEGKCSGILLGGREVVIPFHSIALQKTEDLPDGRARFHIFTVEIACRETTYTAEYAGPRLDVAQYFDCCVFHIIDDDFIPMEHSVGNTDTPVPGDTVYFAGYPLGQQAPSFHKGRVSSVDDASETVCFNIDASVLPGNSGGPVYMMKGEALCLVGVIFAELANIDTHFVGQRQVIASRLGSGTFSFSGVNITQVINQMIDTVFDNMATGIGKVMSIKHVQNLAARAEIPAGPSPFQVGFPIKKTEKLPGMLGKDPKYLDWYHREVKPNKSFCAEILGGKTYDAADQIDTKDELVLRKYYEGHVLSSPTKGHQGVQEIPEEKLRRLEGKILAAKPKALRQNKPNWEKILQEYQGTMPASAVKIQGLIALLNKENAPKSS